MKLCQECIKRGRYSKTNLTIDLREVKHELENNIGDLNFTEWLALTEQKELILKKLMDKELVCNCNRQ